MTEQEQNTNYRLREQTLVDAITCVLNEFTRQLLKIITASRDKYVSKSISFSEFVEINQI